MFGLYGLEDLHRVVNEEHAHQLHVHSLPIALEVVSGCLIEVQGTAIQ